MKLKCLGSGSSGNCYLLENDTECLILDAGISYMEVKKALNFNTRKIVGVVVSHIHTDHSKSVKDYEKAGIPVFKPYEGMKTISMPNCRFTIQAFDLVHNVPNYGFYIAHPDIGSMIYATDTEFIKYKFANLNHILVEANYTKDIVNCDDENFVHVITGHMELETTLRFIQSNITTELRNVVLCHLSEKNADETVFADRARRITSANVYVAKKKLEIELSLPF